MQERRKGQKNCSNYAAPTRPPPRSPPAAAAKASLLLPGCSPLTSPAPPPSPFPVSCGLPPPSAPRSFSPDLARAEIGEETQPDSFSKQSESRIFDSRVATGLGFVPLLELGVWPADLYEHGQEPAFRLKKSVQASGLCSSAQGEIRLKKFVRHQVQGCSSI